MKRPFLNSQIVSLVSLIGLSIATSGCVVTTVGPNGVTTYKNFKKQISQGRVCATVKHDGQTVTNKMAEFEINYSIEKKERSISKRIFLAKGKERCFWIHFDRPISISDLELGETSVTVKVGHKELSAAGSADEIKDDETLHITFDLSNPKGSGSASLEELIIQKALSSLSPPAGERSKMPAEASASASEIKESSPAQPSEGEPVNSEGSAGQAS